jgi:hypothetical protein
MHKHRWLQSVLKDIIYYCQLNDLYDVSAHMKIAEVMLDDAFSRRPSQFRNLDPQEVVALEAFNQNVAILRSSPDRNSRPPEG